MHTSQPSSSAVPPSLRERSRAAFCSSTAMAAGTPALRCMNESPTTAEHRTAQLQLMTKPCIC
jgi:hypothetical protein